MDTVHDAVAWYQKKIGSYDKQLWEQSVEQKLLKGIHHAPRKIGRVKTELIDVDLVRGSTFSKAKPQVPWIAITRLAFVRVIFFPFFYKWWIQQTSLSVWSLLFLLYIMQLIATVVYVLDMGDYLMHENVTLTEVIVPALLMIVLGLVHSQTVLTHFSHKAPFREKKQKREIFKSRGTRKNRSPKTSPSQPQNTEWAQDVRSHVHKHAKQRANLDTSFNGSQTPGSEKESDAQSIKDDASLNTDSVKDDVKQNRRVTCMNLNDDEDDDDGNNWINNDTVIVSDDFADYAEEYSSQDPLQMRVSFSTNMEYIVKETVNKQLTGESPPCESTHVNKLAKTHCPEESRKKKHDHHGSEHHPHSKSLSKFERESQKALVDSKPQCHTQSDSDREKASNIHAYQISRDIHPFSKHSTTIPTVPETDYKSESLLTSKCHLTAPQSLIRPVGAHLCTISDTSPHSYPKNDKNYGQCQTKHDNKFDIVDSHVIKLSDSKSKNTQDAAQSVMDTQDAAQSAMDTQDTAQSGMDTHDAAQSVMDKFSADLICSYKFEKSSGEESSGHFEIASSDENFIGNIDRLRTECGAFKITDSLESSTEEPSSYPCLQMPAETVGTITLLAESGIDSTQEFSSSELFKDSGKLEHAHVNSKAINKVYTCVYNDMDYAMATSSDIDNDVTNSDQVLDHVMTLKPSSEQSKTEILMSESVSDVADSPYSITNLSAGNQQSHISDVQRTIPNVDISTITDSCQFLSHSDQVPFNLKKHLDTVSGLAPPRMKRLTPSLSALKNIDNAGISSSEGETSPALFRPDNAQDGFTGSHTGATRPDKFFFHSRQKAFLPDNAHPEKSVFKLRQSSFPLDASMSGFQGSLPPKSNVNGGIQGFNESKTDLSPPFLQRSISLGHAALRHRRSNMTEPTLHESLSYPRRRIPGVQFRVDKESTGLSSSEGEMSPSFRPKHPSLLNSEEWEDRVQSDMAHSSSSTSSCDSDADLCSDGEPASSVAGDSGVGWTASTVHIINLLQPPSSTSLPQTQSSMPDRVSCMIWEGNDCKKVDLTALDIGWAIIEKVDNIPESSDYIMIGLFFSFLMGAAPLAYRAYMSQTVSDLFTLDGLQNATAAVYDNPWRLNLITGNGIFQRFILGMLFFFLLSVADRTFKQRLLYAKHFSYLTSCRRARKYDMPHFRLNKVCNIKTWLSLRSYLKRRGPQRSVDVIVSSAFMISVIVLALMSIQLLKDSDIFLDSLCNWELLLWSLALGIYILRYMGLGHKINKKYRNLSILITEQINLYLQMEQKPHKKEELMLANSVLRLAEELIKELESPFKISGMSANPFIYNVTKVVLLSAFSAVLTELLGFKLKLYKIKIKP